MYIRFSPAIGAIIVCGVIAGSALGYGCYRYWRLTKYTAELKNEFAATKTELASTTAAFQNAINDIASLTKEKNNLIQDRNQLAGALEDEKNKVDALALQVQSITDTVGVLEKLSKLDPKLLQKYSRIYFLNENYVPDKLIPINEAYLYNKEKEQHIHAGVLPFLSQLMENARNANIDIKIVSAYRSFGTQAELKSSYIFTYGYGSNQFSADQGYSEHQLGTTVDFTTETTGTSFNTFKETPAYAWLKENAHLYGFTLSYPEGNAYYQFEPWHWRFIGRELATKLHNENKYFYDLDQRIIDTYLISLFN